MVTPAQDEGDEVGVAFARASVEIGERVVVAVADGTGVGECAVSVGVSNGEASGMAVWTSAVRVWIALVGEQPASSAARITNQPAKWKDVIRVDTARFIEC
jgi:hypothetical protein